jgi:hypothetical protein
MNKADAEEAAPIVQRAMANLSITVPMKGRPGSDARVAIGDVTANAYIWLRSDILGPHLADVFSLSMQAGATLSQFESIRKSIALEMPDTLGAVLVVNSLIIFCLATEGQIIANTTFISREDIDAVKLTMNGAFRDPEESAADRKDSAAFQALIELHAAITNHLVSTARPLPRMINYRFSKIYPTLVLAYRLYGDASRADELRQENRIIHPAFCPLQGLALSQ